LRHDVVVESTGNRITFIICLIVRIPHDERETSGYKYRVAPGTATTGNGVKDTPVQSQSERDKTVAGNEGGSVRTTVGVKLPWSWSATSRLMTSRSVLGCRGQIKALENMELDTRQIL